MSFTCSNCEGNVAKRQAKGHFFSFGGYGKVRLTQDCEVAFCDQCFEAYPLVDDFSLDQRLEQSLPDNVGEILSVIKERHKIKAKDVAAFCGIEPQTLSRFKKLGKESPIPAETFILLKRIAIDGQSFIEKALSETWEARPSPAFSTRPVVVENQNGRFLYRMSYGDRNPGTGRFSQATSLSRLVTTQDNFTPIAAGFTVKIRP